jgi:hypothetical protein
MYARSQSEVPHRTVLAESLEAVINTLRPLKVARRLWSKVYAITDSGLPSLGTVRGAWLADILRLRSMDQRESTMWRPCRSRGSYFSVGVSPNTNICCDDFVDQALS